MGDPEIKGRDLNSHIKLLAIGTLLIAAGVQGAPLTTADFFRDPQFYDARISPSGNALAVSMPVNGKTSLAVFTDLAQESLHPSALFNMQSDFDIHGFTWVDEQQLVFDTAERTGLLNLPLLHEDLYRASLGDRKLTPLYNADYVSLIDLVPDDRSRLLVNVGGIAQRMNVGDGAFRDIGDAALNGVSYFANHKGEVLVAIGWSETTEDESVVKYRSTASGIVWKELVTQRDTLDGNRGMSGLGYSADDKRFYYVSDEAGSTTAVYALDLVSGAKTLLYRDAREDIGDPIVARDFKTPIGVRVGKGLSHDVYFDPDSAEAKLRREIAGLFPGEELYIDSYSADGSRGIAMVYSDKQPRRCYLVDLKANEIRQLFNSQPWIDPAQMSPMQTVQIKARDGLVLDAFLTVPAASAGKNLPLVVMPHGGPFDISDDWGYNPEAQFLAYHGYAVIQVNFRGSGGYGRDFLRAGFRQWGEKIQDDIVDATQWMINQGIADRERICIYGASFGGYSALEAPLRQPGLYKCAAGYAGVYDLNLWLAAKGGGKFLHQTLGEYGSHLADFSPARHAPELGIPVFLVHGKDDKTVPFDQYENMAKALEKAGHPAELMAVEKEGHGFYKLENKVALYDKLLAFIDRNIGGKAAAKPAAANAGAEAGSVR
jgi:dipeptidyl aminopeptidase/acylaminoacyl peptidase